MNNKIIQFLRKNFLIVSYLFLYFVLISYKLVVFVTPFYDWDESIYAQVGREMVQKLSIVPLWQGQYWLDKPPLTPLAYGIVEKVVPLPAEISTRLFTLFLTVIVLYLTYVLYNRVIKNPFLSTLAIVITSFIPLFLQRTQVLNVDIFLLLGWIGYVLFYDRFYISLFFLAVGVLSKSLLGFYPPLLFIGYFIFEYVFKKTDVKELRKKCGAILLQIGILSLWYIGMILVFKGAFIRDHFIDSHLKRVTASIESHFGTRTYYIELLLQQLSVFSWLLPLGLFFSIYDFLKKKDVKAILLFLFFVPWFLFLNLTKTKIAWYLYPVFSQFAFLAVVAFYPLRKVKFAMILICTIIAGYVLYQNLYVHSYLSDTYSRYDDTYRVALIAKKQCSSIDALIDKDSRQTHDTLKQMNLLISTSEWWGNHPALVYYSQKPVNFIYDPRHFWSEVEHHKNGQCFLMDKKDVPQTQEKSKLHLIQQEGDVYLYQ